MAEALGMAVNGSFYGFHKSLGSLFSCHGCLQQSFSKWHSLSLSQRQYTRSIRVPTFSSEAFAADGSRPRENMESTNRKNIRILIAGGGIGGLVFALAAKRRGFQVTVFERNMNLIRGEGRYFGPIQLQSNALAVLEAIDLDVVEEIISAGCLTGNRVNGLADGISGDWYIKFDTFTPAVKRGLPLTRVICRMTLQEILVQAVGREVIMNDSHVIGFEDDGSKVTLILENGERHDGDLLVGADGIWSKIRKNLYGPDKATYSGYTCYSGIVDFLSPDIKTVGYRIFLGHKQYFVSSDVGAGKMQWYAFNMEPPGGSDPPYGKKERLQRMFNGWCDNVVELIFATEEEAIFRRDIYDREPAFTWAKGRVTLLGDSVHAMQPSMGQGGCMAVEDSYQLALELEKAWQQSHDSGVPVDIPSSLKCYERKRRFRVAVVHGMTRMATFMVSHYRSYLDVGLGPFSFQIPHPGRTVGWLVLKYALPSVLSWMIGGYSSNLKGMPLSCRLADKFSYSCEGQHGIP